MKPVRGFELTHAVTEYGDVIALQKTVQQPSHPIQKTRTTNRRVLSAGSNGKGYLFVVLNDGFGKQERRYVHRIVAEAYLPNPCNYPQINHKDRNKSNNKVLNLEWCDASYNNKHRYLTDKVLRGDFNKKPDSVVTEQVYEGMR